MNRKDESIVDLLARLDVATRGWQIVDHWEADLHAIGVAAKRDASRLVYVSTFAQVPGRFDFQCETQAGSNDDGYASGATGEGVDYDVLLKAMTDHLGE